MPKKPTSRAAKKDAEVFGLKRAASGLWSARLSIPRDRWHDVGLAYQTKSGIRQEFLKSLQTHDKQEAIRRRGKALDALRNQVNGKLEAIGKKTLSGDWTPDWATPEKAVEAGLHYRQQIEQASDAYDPAEDYEACTVAEGGPNSEREHVRSVVTDLVLEAADKLPPAESQRYLKTVMGMVDGTHTPLGPLLDRWEAERNLTISKSSQAMDKTAIKQFATYVAEYDEERQGITVTNPVNHLRAKSIESLELRMLGGFSEWLLGTAGLHPKTTATRISSMKMLWQWCIRKHVIAGPNPWDGATSGLKQQAARQGNPKRREFSEDELLALFAANPAERRWAWGEAIRDLMRLALLTGARENELCSLTVDRIVQVNGASLLGIAVIEEDAKTVNSIRKIPVHPLIRPIIERRLAAAKATGQPDAPLFPECKPGGVGKKRSHYFAQRFTDFRREVLGDASDNVVTFHSFRKCFGTFMRRASVAGVSECQLSVAQKLMGHKPQTITESVYMEQDMPWPTYEAAILGMVDKGVPERVREALSAWCR
ncbi:tyrosine-type recombinase/integrase [Acetobacter indonesiensis]|uniref:tyrosine-type recombinase/integrase n=1 Tax=Acetobacter indonesiensis TaxID=104101 RepID=UPI000A3CA56B|nr:tyrosine-type recombinase/integrase [Acetobacter indonesiensis]